MNSSASWAVWITAVGAYAVAVMQRSAIGVAGQEAAAQFSTTVAVVSTFVMVQLLAYAALQIPAGIMLDRYGPRTMIAAGSVIMGLGQVALGLTDDLSLAIVARLFVGAGDACIFGGTLRIIPAWFSPVRVPILSQMTGILGQLGQLGAIGAMLPTVRNMGWSIGIIGAASASFLLAVAAWWLIQNAPRGRSATSAPTTSLPPRASLLSVAKEPATWLGFFVHYTAGFSVNVFLMMWGLPYLMIAQQRSEAEASVLFIVAVIGSIIFGPIIGHLTARHPLRRSNLALIVIYSMLLVWALVLLWPAPAPTWLLVLLLIAVSAGGPGTGIGFDYTRTLLPHSRMGTANGVVITGSFSGSVMCLVAIAVWLGISAGGGQPNAEQLTWAMAIQLPFFLIGLTGIYISRTVLRRRMAKAGVVIPTWREVVGRIQRRRRQQRRHRTHTSPKD